MGIISSLLYKCPWPIVVGGIFYVAKPMRGLDVCEMHYGMFTEKGELAGLCSLQVVHLVVEEDAFADVGEALREI